MRFAGEAMGGGFGQLANQGTVNYGSCWRHGYESPFQRKESCCTS